MVVLIFNMHYDVVYFLSIMVNIVFNFRDGCNNSRSNKKSKWIFADAFNTFTSIPSHAAIALKWQYYRQLVPLRVRGSPQPLDKTLALLGPH